MNWSEVDQTTDASTSLALLYKAETAWDIRPLTLAPNGEDEGGGLLGCPCFAIRLAGFEADGHCWRVGCGPEDARCCVHVRGDKAHGERLKYLLDKMNWYGEWTLTFGPDCYDLKAGESTKAGSV